jgi:hypothetical protein
MKGILWNKPIRTESMVNWFLKKAQPYWTRYKYCGKWYIMTFQYNIYQIVD